MRAARRLVPPTRAKPLPHRAAGILSDGDSVRVQAGTAGVRFLLLAAKSHEASRWFSTDRSSLTRASKSKQALADYRSGHLAAAAPG